VQDDFGVALPIRVLFEEGTVAAMARALEEVPHDDAAVAAKLRAQIDQMNPVQIQELLKQKRAASAAGRTVTGIRRDHINSGQEIGK
jgi:hypothetical protein